MRHWQLAIGIAHNRSGHLGSASQAARAAKKFSKSENNDRVLNFNVLTTSFKRLLDCVNAQFFTPILFQAFSQPFQIDMVRHYIKL